MDLNKLLPNYVQMFSLLRTALQAIGIVIAQYGWFTSQQWGQMTDAVITLIGVLIFLGTTIWSLMVHKEKALIQTVAQLPSVQTVVAAPPVANSIPDPNVIASLGPVVKLLALFILIPLLGGCQSVGQLANVVSVGSQIENVSLKDVYALRAGYGAAFLAPAANYRRLPLCEKAAAPCAERVVIVQLQKADRVAQEAIMRLENFVRDNPGKIGVAGLYDAAKAAIAQAQSIVLEYKIGSAV